MDIASRVRSVVARASESFEDVPKSPRVGMVVDMSDAHFIGGFIPSLVEKPSYPYARPQFLFYADEETTLSADKTIRPVVCPKFPHKMPLQAGYAEVINAGKTALNEDQASAKLLVLSQQGYEAEEARVLEVEPNSSNGSRRSSPPDEELLLSREEGHQRTSSSNLCAPKADAALFAIFDGHAGTGAALVASKCLHEHIKSRLSSVLEPILHLDRNENIMFGRRRSDSSYSFASEDDVMNITSEQLVTGALEAAFVDMDTQIAEDKQTWKLPGGCAVICAFVLLGKIYVANAGDCRAVVVTSSGARALSQDFTPANERKRLQSLAFYNPDLIGNHFTRLQYSRHLTKRDLNTKVLYRDWFMDGWAAKNVKESDLRPPLISDTFKKKRLLNTIGVSRGFGDHHLLTVDDRLSIKPFLSPVPEVQVLDVRRLDSLDDKDVLILASDGLWDVLSNEDAARIVRAALSETEIADAARYSMAAQELLIAARGDCSEENKWIMNSGSYASTDDITVFVIPLKHCIAPPQEDSEEDDDVMICLSPE